MKTNLTPLVTKAHTVENFKITGGKIPFTFEVPEDIKVTSQTAMGYDQNVNFLNEFYFIHNNFNKRDLENYGYDVPLQYLKFDLDGDFLEEVKEGFYEAAIWQDERFEDLGLTADSFTQNTKDLIDRTCEFFVNNLPVYKGNKKGERLSIENYEKPDQLGHWLCLQLMGHGSTFNDSACDNTSFLYELVDTWHRSATIGDLDFDLDPDDLSIYTDSKTFFKE